MGKTKIYSIHDLKDSWRMILLLIVVNIAIAFLIAKIHLLVSPIILILVIGIPFIVISFKDYRWAFYGGFLLTCFGFYFERLIPADIPYGVFCDLLFATSFISLLFNSREREWKEKITHPITIGYFLIFVYQFLQVFNPNAVSLWPWIYSQRTLVMPLLLLVCIAMLRKESGMKLFLILWIGIGIMAGVYGLYQEFFGLAGFELNWVLADPLRYGLYYILGHMRVFSFLSDPSAFGVFMAATALACFALMLGPISGMKKIILGAGSLIMLGAMLYSGTRTAYAMVAVGIFFMTLISIRKRRTLVFAVLGATIFIALIYGPFYSPAINRFRSAFKPHKDASMEVRDVKRMKFRSYIHDHPIGGGLNTTGSSGVRFSPGHPLATGVDADSGYLRTALEQGWIGLAVLLIFFFVAMKRGISNYFALEDSRLQHYNLAYLVPFFATSVANFTQHAVLYKPMYIVIIAAFAVIINLETFESKKLNYPIV